MRYILTLFVALIITFGPAMSYASVCCCMKDKEANQTAKSEMPCHDEDNSQTAKSDINDIQKGSDFCPDCDCDMMSITKIIVKDSDFKTNDKFILSYRMNLKDEFNSKSVNTTDQPPKA